MRARANGTAVIPSVLLALVWAVPALAVPSTDATASPHADLPRNDSAATERTERVAVRFETSGAGGEVRTQEESAACSTPCTLQLRPGSLSFLFDRLPLNAMVPRSDARVVLETPPAGAFTLPRAGIVAGGVIAGGSVMYLWLDHSVSTGTGTATGRQLSPSSIPLIPLVVGGGVLVGSLIWHSQLRAGIAVREVVADPLNAE
jgi:hypothetical protein